MRLVIVNLLFAGLFSPVVCAAASEPVPAPRGPIRSLAEYARQLKDPDIGKQVLAAEAIRDHYKGRYLEVMPQVIEALADYLDRQAARWRTASPFLEKLQSSSPGDFHPPPGSLPLPPPPPPERPKGLGDLYSAIRDIVRGAGPGRVKAAEEATHSPNAWVRAAGFAAWVIADSDTDAGLDWSELRPAVRRGLKDESPHVRYHAVMALYGVRGAPQAVIDEAIKLLITSLDDRVPSREGHSDGDNPAFGAASILGAYGAKARPAFGALVEAIEKDRDTDIVSSFCLAIAAIAKGDPTVAEEAVKVLRSVFTDKRRPERVRDIAIRNLIGIGPAARWAIPDLIDILEDPKGRLDLRLAALTALEDMGPRAAPAVPAMVKRLELATDEREQSRILYAFKAAGPVAVSATDALKRYREKVRNPALEKRAYEAQLAIEK